MLMRAPAIKDKDHGRNLDDMLVIEDILSKRYEFASKDELRFSLPKRIQYKTFNRILKNLEESNKIIYDKDGSILWIFAQGSKLARLEKEPVRLR